MRVIPRDCAIIYGDLINDFLAATVFPLGPRHPLNVAEVHLGGLLKFCLDGLDVLRELSRLNRGDDALADKWPNQDSRATRRCRKFSTQCCATRRRESVARHLEMGLRQIILGEQIDLAGGRYNGFFDNDRGARR